MKYSEYQPRPDLLKDRIIFICTLCLIFKRKTLAPESESAAIAVGPRALHSVRFWRAVLFQQSPDVWLIYLCILAEYSFRF
jgi:hypothetical protein